jgi:hypothetical protein
MEDKRLQSRTPRPSKKHEQESQAKPRYTDEDFEEMERILMKIDCLIELQKAGLRRERRPFRF